MLKGEREALTQWIVVFILFFILLPYQESHKEKKEKIIIS